LTEADMSMIVEDGRLGICVALACIVGYR
jgi:hypothetical protein